MRIGHKHALPTRLFHWLNAVVLAIMIWSGILIYWAYPVYKIKLFGVVLLKFFPDWFFKNSLWSLDHRLAEGLGAGCVGWAGHARRRQRPTG